MQLSTMSSSAISLHHLQLSPWILPSCTRDGCAPDTKHALMFLALLRILTPLIYIWLTLTSFNQHFLHEFWADQSILSYPLTTPTNVHHVTPYIFMDIALTLLSFF